MCFEYQRKKGKGKNGSHLLTNPHPPITVSLTVEYLFFTTPNRTMKKKKTFPWRGNLFVC